MKQKEKLNCYPFVELPDPKVRYLIRTHEYEPIAVLRFDDDGTPRIRYLRPITPDEELPLIDFMNDKQRLLFG